MKRRLYEDEDGISDVELLIIRHLKSGHYNENIFRRLVGKYYALSPEYIDKSTIFHCLWGLINKFDLLIHPDKDGGFFFNRESYLDLYDFEDIWDEWIWRAMCRIQLSNVNKFPRYPIPTRHKNSRSKELPVKD